MSRSTIYVNWNEIGVTQYNEQQFGLAADCFLEAIRINPRHSQALNNLGILYENGQGVGEINLFQASIYYLRAANEGNFAAAIQYVRISTINFTEDDLAPIS